MNTTRDGRIVVGVDETALSGPAVRWAAEQARLEGRGVLLVNAGGPVNPSLVDRPVGLPGGFPLLEKDGRALLARAEQQVRATAPTVDVEQLFGIADAATLLLQASSGACMTVLGSRGRGPTLTHFLGSVGIAVVRRATTPVVVHRPGHPGVVHRGVLAAVGAEPAAQRVLDEAFRIASLRGLPLRVVHYVYDARSVLVGVPLVGDPADQEQEEQLAVAEALAGLRERYPDVHVRVETDRGVPEHDLPRASQGADLLVVGTHQRRAIDRLLAGSVSEAVLEHSTCPVLVVPAR
jgi:nucleotide-binding universal stress UspA family protein